MLHVKSEHALQNGHELDNILNAYRSNLINAEKFVSYRNWKEYCKT